MKCTVIKPFKACGQVQPVGSMVEVAESMLLEMVGYIQPVATADSYIATWPPPFKAWLTDDGELRSIGVCDDLTAEIRSLTVDDMALQAKLLRLHCQQYTGIHWQTLAKACRDRSRNLVDEGYGIHEATYRAAAEMHLLAFVGELRLEEPPP